MIAPSLMDPSAHVITYKPMTEDTGTKKYDFSICEHCSPHGLS